MSLRNRTIKNVFTCCCLLVFLHCDSGTSRQNTLDVGPNISGGPDLFYPHPNDWISQHGEKYLTDANGVCIACHDQRDDAPECSSCHPSFPHDADWVNKMNHGQDVLKNGKNNCLVCHAENPADLQGEGPFVVACNTCHSIYPHNDEWGTTHGESFKELGRGVCENCHGENLDRILDGKNCFTCHQTYPHGAGWITEGWNPGAPPPNSPSLHGPAAIVKINDCKTCHEDQLNGAPEGFETCETCHRTLSFHDTAQIQPQGSWKLFTGHATQVLDVLNNNLSECQTCHGADNKGGVSQVSCYNAACHVNYPHQGLFYENILWKLPLGQPQGHGRYVIANGTNTCATERCHGPNLQPVAGVTRGPSCSSANCHHGPGWITEGWNPGDPPPQATSQHGIEARQDANRCKICHGGELEEEPGCKTCHASIREHDFTQIGIHAQNWNTFERHALYVLDNLNNNKYECQICHGTDFEGGVSNVTCYNAACHLSYPHKEGWGLSLGQDHHSHFIQANGDASCQTERCHGVNYVRIPNITRGTACQDCHDHEIPSPPQWRNEHDNYVNNNLGGNVDRCRLCHGNDLNGGRSGVSCNDCHNGAACFDCHDEPRRGRRSIVGPGGDFARNSHHVINNLDPNDCLVCHYMNDHWSGVVKLKDPDAGEAVVYNYDPLNPKATEAFCLNCHDSDGARSAGGNQPFQDGRIVPNIKGPEGSSWTDSAHNQRNYGFNNDQPLTCMGNGINGGCHANGHGSDNEKILSRGGSINQLCITCHTEGHLTNNAISGANLADDIEQAFGLNSVHDLETQFTIGQNEYTLQCTSCHNPHVVSGKYEEAALGKSPITRPDLEADPALNPRAVGTTLWGASEDQKMDDYAGPNGVYQTPHGDSLDGDQLPDYVTFCLDCHNQPGPSPFGMQARPLPDVPIRNSGKNWNNDPHGRFAANLPRGMCPSDPNCGEIEEDVRECPDDPGCGDAANAWPRIPLGRGFANRTISPYRQSDRIAGENFVLACTDCHEAHGSSKRFLIRTNTNNAEVFPFELPATDPTWDLCFNCHRIDYGMKWPNNCTSNNCHGYMNQPSYIRGSLHGMNNNLNGDVNFPLNVTVEFDREEVVHLRFDQVHSNNPVTHLYELDDAGTWHLSGRGIDPDSNSAWPGTNVDVNFSHNLIRNRINGLCVVSGANNHIPQFGCSVLLDGVNDFIELGATNTAWPSTIYGNHQYFEMHDHVTVSAWIRPDPIQPGDDEDQAYTILSNADENADANYSLYLYQNNGNYKLAFKVAVGPNTWRGACSTPDITATPANNNGPWTHVAATFDAHNQAGSNRIKIYINGQDVTDNNPATCHLVQPGANEAQIRAGFDAEVCVPMTIGASSPPLVCRAANWPPNGALQPLMSGSNYYRGRIDEVRIFNVTKNNILDLMNPSLPPPQ